MPPPSPRHLLPQVLQIMPRNPKYDQFQPKSHHNEENPQSMTKMPGNPKFYPFHWVKIASKLEKSTNCSHNLINQFWKWSGYISMQNFRPFPQWVFPENAWKLQIWPVSLSQNSTKITKINRPWPWTNQLWRWSRYIIVQNFRPFPPCVLRQMPGNPQFDPFH